MSEKRTALIEKIGRRVDRTISNSRSSFDAWVDYQFEGAAKIVDRQMKQGVDKHAQRHDAPFAAPKGNQKKK